jgi:hypothetical protein
LSIFKKNVNISHKLFRIKIIKALINDYRKEINSFNTEKKISHKKGKCFLAVGKRKKDCFICSNQYANLEKEMQIYESFQNLLQELQKLQNYEIEKSFGKKRKRIVSLCGNCEINICPFPCFEINKRIIKLKTKNLESETKMEEEIS